MMRVGIGFDAHRFADDRKLMIGGVEVPHDRGLHGHSDADVLLHALADAMLGAAGLDDIGTHFPDSDSRWKGVPSALFIREIRKKLARRKWRIVNADLIIIAQAPKLQPHREDIRKSVAAILGLTADRVNVKATSSDRMGFTGRGEGIAAQAVVLLERHKAE